MKTIKGFFAQHIRIADLGLNIGEVVLINGRKYRYGIERECYSNGRPVPGGKVIAHFLEPVQ